MANTSDAEHDRLAAAVEILDRLVAFDTTSARSNIELIDWVAEYLQSHGIGSTRSAAFEGKANLFATIGPAERGGVILSGPKVVVTRTADGAVHGFSAVCTHQGCTVDVVGHGTIDCPCHGSRFDAATGAVVAGPALRPLPPIGVEVRNGQVFRT